MTDLTEQLYAGTLPTGHYYFNNGVETYIVLYSNANTKDMKMQEPSGLTVLSEVPSYDEWVYLHKARNDAHEIVESLTQENRQLKTFLKKAINIVMESNWENHAHYKDSIQLRDETNNLLNDSPSPTDLKQG